jgi:hypothetical protein
MPFESAHRGVKNLNDEFSVGTQGVGLCSSAGVMSLIQPTHCLQIGIFTLTLKEFSSFIDCLKDEFDNLSRFATHHPFPSSFFLKIICLPAFFSFLPIILALSSLL